MNVLVTGASGFIGSHIVPELLSRGVRVTAVSRDPDRISSMDWAGDVEVIHADLSADREDWFDYLGRPDAVVHAAWDGLPNYLSTFHYEVNLWSSYRFVKSMVSGGLRDVTVLGTCFEYGMADGRLDEGMPTDPSNPYGIAKDSLRRFIEQLQRDHRFDFRWVRLFYLYGERQNPRSLMAQLEKAVKDGADSFDMSGGEQLRDYLHVRDAARIISSVALQDRVQGVINCCSGRPVSVRGLVEGYLREKGVSMKLNLGRYPYPDFEPMAFWGDDRKMKKALEG